MPPAPAPAPTSEPRNARALERSARTWSLILAVPVVVALLGVRLQSRPPDRNWSGRVLAVLDGDTVRVGEGLFTRTVRLADVDCPEHLQPYGEAARDFLHQLVRGQGVVVHARGLDKYGRTVGELVTEDGRNASEELLRAGLAWFNVRYSDHPELGKLEAAARAARRGLWKQRRPQSPWAWRHENR